MSVLALHHHPDKGEIRRYGAAAIVIVLAGFTVAVVEAMQLPKDSIWVVVAVAAFVVGVIRALTSR
jgi:uncharacterized membrane protein YccC